MNQKTIIIAIGFLIAFCAGIIFYAEWQKRFEALLPEAPILPPKPPPTPIQNTDAGGHWHDGEWHAEPHTPATFAVPIDEIPPIGNDTVSETNAQYVPYISSENPALAELYQMLNVATPEGEAPRNSPYGIYLLEKDAWQREYAALRAEEAALDREDEELGLNNPDAFVKTIDRLSTEEREALVEKIEALQQKWQALWEKKRAHRAAKPIEPPHGREQGMTITHDVGPNELLTESEIEELNQTLQTEGFHPEKLSQRQLDYLSVVGINMDMLPPEQRQEFIEQADREFYAQFGLKPPPKGYRYSFKDISKGILNVDENGEPILRKKAETGTPVSR